LQRSARRAARPLAAALAIAAAACLTGCGSISEKFASTASQMPAIGLPSGAPERPSTPPAYPAVHDMPAPRNSVILTGVEQAQMERDLTEARDRTQTSAGVETQAKKKAKTAAPTTLKPGARGATIY
jgi:hypothetical protein